MSDKKKKKKELSGKDLAKAAGGRATPANPEPINEDDPTSARGGSSSTSGGPRVGAQSAGQLDEATMGGVAGGRRVGQANREPINEDDPTSARGGGSSTSGGGLRHGAQSAGQLDEATMGGLSGGRRVGQANREPINEDDPTSARGGGSSTSGGGLRHGAQSAGQLDEATMGGLSGGRASEASLRPIRGTSPTDPRPSGGPGVSAQQGGELDEASMGGIAGGTQQAGGLTGRGTRDTLGSSTRRTNEDPDEADGEQREPLPPV